MTFVAFLVGQVLGVNDAGASRAIQAGFVVDRDGSACVRPLCAGLSVGVVLRTKLPAFPMRNWLALYVVLGVIFGLISGIAWLTPDTSPDVGGASTPISSLVLRSERPSSAW